MKPTDEQLAVVDLFRTGQTMVVDALAGSGKTTTLQLLAGSTRRRGIYLAYNKAIVQDVAGRLPARCPARTGHSVAMAAVGGEYRHRLGAPRMKSAEVARILGIQPITVTTGLPKAKRLAPGWLAGHVMQAVMGFCNSADDEPDVQHFPYRAGLDMPDEQGNRRTVNNRLVAHELVGALRKAWLDLSNPDGVLVFRHDHYFKHWCLSRPTIHADFILLDEAQDTNPPLARVLSEQDAQVVMVGDANQQLYEWRGAVDAMERFPSEHRRALTQTWRFGQTLADRANEILDELDAPHHIVGHPEKVTTVGALAPGVAADAVLCRTNAQALHRCLAAQMQGRAVHLVGGGQEAAAFARAVQDLRKDGFTSHPDLSCFDSWHEVQEFVARDPGGSELRLMVSLVEQFGTEGILRAVSGTVPDAPGVQTVSTAHRAKGRQWPVVQLAGDFAEMEETPAELRLRYVAVTRAQEHMDCTVLDPLAEQETPAGGVLAAEGTTG